MAPGMTDTSLLPMAIAAAGLDLGKTLAALVSRAVDRHAGLAIVDATTLTPRRRCAARAFLRGLRHQLRMVPVSGRGCPRTRARRRRWSSRSPALRVGRLDHLL